jgi:hypothetical protein
LRLPRSLHRQATQLAELDGVSLNQFIVAALAEKVGAVNVYRGLTRHLTWIAEAGTSTSPKLRQTPRRGAD